MQRKADLNGIKAGWRAGRIFCEPLNASEEWMTGCGEFENLG